MQVIHPNKRTAGVTDGPFVNMSFGLMRSTLPWPTTLPLWNCFLFAQAGAKTYRSNPIFL